MATAKGTAKKVAEASLEPVVVGSPEWLAMKAEAKKRLDNL